MTPSESKVRPDSVLEEEKPVPEREEEIIRSAMSMVSFRGPMHPAVYEKINEEHIHKLLDHSEHEDRRGFQYAREGRFLKYGMSVALIIVFILLTLFLVDRDKELYKDILQVLIILGGGIGIGKGFFSKKK